MKKITLMAALLGSAYFANAQVGIGTPAPNASAMLDITATNKGVLIPRVELTDASTALSGATTHENSLLVYNTNTSDANVADVKKVTPGFYYWNVNKWERIVNQSQLDTAITNVTNLQGDVTKIKALLDAAYGSNNLGDTATSDSFGGMVFTPATGTYGQAGYVAPVIEYVKWNTTTSSYDKVNVTSQLIDLIHGNETKTTLARSVDAGNYTPITADPKAATKVTYEYSAEGGVKNYIDVTADIVTSITNNTGVQNAISNVLNQGGNVYYGDVNGKNVFYTIDVNGDKFAITIPVDIDQLITTINTTSVEKKNELKLALGDKMTTDNTSVFTGNTITIGGDVHYIYKGNFTTTVNANSAVTTGVTLDKAAAKILSLDLRYNGGMVANVTTMTLNGTALGFNIGTGNMYQVLGTTDIDADVVIEFASTAVPAGITTTTP